MTDPEPDRALIVPVLDERLRVGVRSVGSDRVVLYKTVRREDATAEAVLRSESLDVERVPIGRVVETAPPVGEEGGTLIVPVVEEIMVVGTRLVLKEELRVRRITGSRMQHRVVRLRRFNRRYESTGTGLWASIRSMFVPEEDAHGYAEGVERGHAMLVVRPRPEQREEAVRILESYEPIDFDARQAQWRESGWSGVHQGAATVPGAAATTPAAAAVNPSPQERDAGRTGSGDRGTGRRSERRRRIGKREVAQGAVRVRSYVVETPVEERGAAAAGRRAGGTPVDRPAADLPADAFRERAIEVQATSEEPVLSKEARVVEEVELRKKTGERSETVRDTTRRTDVTVEDDRAGAPDASGAVTRPPRT